MLSRGHNKTTMNYAVASVQPVQKGYQMPRNEHVMHRAQLPVVVN